MLSFGATTKKGPIAVIGISSANIDRMRAGQPLRIDLKALTRKGQRINEVFVHHAHTYSSTIDDIIDAGFNATDEMRQAAVELDDIIDAGFNATDEMRQAAVELDEKAEHKPQEYITVPVVVAQHICRWAENSEKPDKETETAVAWLYARTPKEDEE